MSTPSRRIHPAIILALVTVLAAITWVAWYTHDPIAGLRCPYPTGPVARNDNPYQDAFIHAPDSAPVPDYKLGTPEWDTIGVIKTLRIKQPKQLSYVGPNPGPTLTPNDEGVIPLPTGESVRLLGFATWDFTRDAQARPTYHDHQGRPIPAKNFLQRAHLTADHIGYGHPYGIHTFFEFPPNLPVHFHGEFLRPRNTSTFYDELYPTGGIGVQHSGDASSLSIHSAWPIRPANAPMDFCIRLSYGTRKSIPIPARDGEVVWTRNGYIHRITSATNPFTFENEQEPVNASPSHPVTVLECSRPIEYNREDNDIAWHQGCLVLPTAKLAALKPEEYPHDVRIRIPIPQNLPKPDFSRTDVLDSVIRSEAEPQVYSLNDIAQWLGLQIYPDPPERLKLHDFPEIKTLRDLVRVVARQPEYAGLSPKWYADEMQLQFERPVPRWKRAVLTVNNHAPYLVPERLLDAAQSND